MTTGARIVQEWRANPDIPLPIRINAALTAAVVVEREALAALVRGRAESMRAAEETTPKGGARDCYHCAANELELLLAAIRARQS